MNWETSLRKFAKDMIQKYSVVDPEFLKEDVVIEKIVNILDEETSSYIGTDILEIRSAGFKQAIAERLLHPVLGVNDKYVLKHQVADYMYVLQEILSDLEHFLPTYM